MLKKINTPLAFGTGSFLGPNMKRPVILYLKSRYAPLPQQPVRYSAAGIYFAERSRISKKAGPLPKIYIEGGG